MTASVQADRGHLSDQMGVWQEVALQQAQYRVASPTGAMSDAFDSYKESIEGYQQRLPYPDGATGLAVAIRDRIVAVDVFDKPSTCQKVWNRLLSGYYFDAAQAGATDKEARGEDVEALLQNVERLPWQESPAVGEGEEFRAESGRGDQASVLSCEGVVVHESVLAGV